MIDTVILTIKQGGFKIPDLGKFKTNPDAVKNTKGLFYKWTNNPTSQDKRSGIYKPRLTLIKKRKEKTYNEYEHLLKIEFSAPKMIYNDNVNELDENDFAELVKVLKLRLADMGVNVDEEAIRNADVSSFHPAKNIPLTNGSTSTLAIKELSKINLNEKLDMNQTDFRNGGHSLQCYANSHSLAIYDKIKDFNKPAGRAIDKDQTSRQMNIFKQIKKSKEYLEVLKIEVRLSNKTKMNSVLKELGYSKNPNFQDVFNKQLCQKIIKSYWEKIIIGKNVFLFDTNNNPQNILKNILSHYPSIKLKKLKKAIYLAGLSILCKDDGITALRAIMGSYGLKTAWGKLRGDIEALNEVSLNSQNYGFMGDIERVLDDFNPFRYNGSA